MVITCGQMYNNYLFIPHGSIQILSEGKRVFVLCESGGDLYLTMLCCNLVWLVKVSKDWNSSGCWAQSNKHCVNDIIWNLVNCQSNTTKNFPHWGLQKSKNSHLKVNWMWRDLTKFQLEFPFYWQWKCEPSVGDDHSSWISVVGPPVLNHPWPYWCNAEVKWSSGLSIYMPQKISHLLSVRLGGWETHIQLYLTRTLSCWWKLELSGGDICTLQDPLLANLYWGVHDLIGIIH